MPETPETDVSSPREGLPFAKGRTFLTLDEYLAYRKQLGQLDRPYYEEVSPGVYRLVARAVPRDQAKLYTRAELMAEFGFTH